MVKKNKQLSKKLTIRKQRKPLKHRLLKRRTASLLRFAKTKALKIRRKYNRLRARRQTKRRQWKKYAPTSFRRPKTYRRARYRRVFARHNVRSDVRVSKSLQSCRYLRKTVYRVAKRAVYKKIRKYIYTAPRTRSFFLKRVRRILRKARRQRRIRINSRVGLFRFRLVKNVLRPSRQSILSYRRRRIKLLRTATRKRKYALNKYWILRGRTLRSRLSIRHRATANNPQRKQPRSFVFVNKNKKVITRLSPTVLMGRSEKYFARVSWLGNTDRSSLHARSKHWRHPKFFKGKQSRRMRWRVRQYRRKNRRRPLPRRFPRVFPKLSVKKQLKRLRRRLRRYVLAKRKNRLSGARKLARRGKFKQSAKKMLKGWLRNGRKINRIKAPTRPLRIQKIMFNRGTRRPVQRKRKRRPSRIRKWQRTLKLIKRRAPALKKRRYKNKAIWRKARFNLMRLQKTLRQKAKRASKTPVRRKLRRNLRVTRLLVVKKVRRRVRGRKAIKKHKKYKKHKGKKSKFVLRMRRVPKMRKARSRRYFLRHRFSEECPFTLRRHAFETFDAAAHRENLVVKKFCIRKTARAVKWLSAVTSASRRLSVLPLVSTYVAQGHTSRQASEFALAPKSVIAPLFLLRAGIRSRLKAFRRYRTRRKTISFLRGMRKVRRARRWARRSFDFSFIIPIRKRHKRGKSYRRAVKNLIGWGRYPKMWWRDKFRDRRAARILAKKFKFPRHQAFALHLKKAAFRHRSLRHVLRYRVRKTARRCLAGNPYSFRRAVGYRRKVRRAVRSFISKKSQKLLHFYYVRRRRKRLVKKVRRRKYVRVLSQHVKRPRYVSTTVTTFNKSSPFARKASSTRRTQLLGSIAPAAPRSIYTLELQHALAASGTKQTRFVAVARRMRVSRWFPKGYKRRRTFFPAKRIRKQKRQMRRRLDVYEKHLKSCMYPKPRSLRSKLGWYRCLSKIAKRKIEATEYALVVRKSARRDAAMTTALNEIDN